MLHFDAANVEAIASLASHHFYTDQPEVALRFYRRLVQMGINNTELWNNLGLCCFYASQYDYTVCVCVCVWPVLLLHLAVGHTVARNVLRALIVLSCFTL